MDIVSVGDKSGCTIAEVLEDKEYVRRCLASTGFMEHLQQFHPWMHTMIISNGRRAQAMALSKYLNSDCARIVGHKCIPHMPAILTLERVALTQDLLLTRDPTTFSKMVQTCLQISTCSQHEFKALDEWWRSHTPHQREYRSFLTETGSLKVLMAVNKRHGAGFVDVKKREFFNYLGDKISILRGGSLCYDVILSSERLEDNTSLAVTFKVDDLQYHAFK